MAKVVIQVKDKKDNNEKCTITISIDKKSMEKATDTEKGTVSMIYNKVCEMLNSLQ